MNRDPHTRFRLTFSACFATILISSFCIPHSSFGANAPLIIPFQGRLTNQQGVPYTTGQYTIVFNIYSQAIGGTTQWTERHEKVGVTNGMISVFLGSITSLPTTVGNPPVAFFSTTRYLGITVDADDNAATADPEMVPRQMIIPAFHAKNADKMASQFGNFDWSAVFGTGVDPGTNNVSLSKIPTLTVDKLPDNIPASKLETGAALTNLTSGGVSGVATGGIVLSANANDAALIAAGYTKLGVGQFGEGWRQGKSVGAPAARGGAFKAWSGNKMIVWGGVKGDTARTTFGDGAMYDPTLDQWSSITPTNAPGARTGFAVGSTYWTGQELFVWGGVRYVDGGSSTQTIYGDGALYNPVTNSWRAVSNTSAPTARHDILAVWSPELGQMVLWSGYDANPPYRNEGFKYSPSGNGTWATTSNANSPGGRQNAMCVWTGAEMIVWGGFTSWGGVGGLSNAGGRFNPQSNTWAAMSTTNAPSPRRFSYVAWTGSEMFVWGGNSGSGGPGDGALYNPTTDSWRTISSVGAPEAGGSGIAVWTGAEVVIWGGINFNNNAYLSRGARFNPSTNSWALLPQVNASGRDGCAAVWSGQEVLIFGGLQNEVAFNDMLIYTPPRTLYLYQRN